MVRKVVENQAQSIKQPKLCLWSWASACLLQPWEELWSPYRYWWEGIINETENLPMDFFFFVPKHWIQFCKHTRHKSSDTAGNVSQNPGFLNKVRIKTCEVLRIEKWSQLTGYKWRFYNYRKNGSHWKKHRLVSQILESQNWRYSLKIRDHFRFKSPLYSRGVRAGW